MPQALRAVSKGGTVVCGGIHMSDIPALPYRILWEERTITSVANVTRSDAEEFMSIASSVPLWTSVETFPLTEANKALARLREGKSKGAAVLLTDVFAKFVGYDPVLPFALHLCSLLRNAFMHPG